jgi:YD repeat-containing protein
VKNACLLLSLLFVLGGVGFSLCAQELHAQEPKIRYTYDDLGRLKQVIDQDGNVRTYNYDAVGNILSIEAGTGGCPLAPPVITGIQPDSCQAGTTCQIMIDGSSLDGAGVTSSNPQAVISDCQTDCTQITCRLTPSPLLSPGAINVIVTNSEGSTQTQSTFLRRRCLAVLDRPIYGISPRA